jgi:tRNA pseudouridine55 synthase
MKRRGRPIHGWIVLDKPLGLSSAGAVAAVKRALDAAKAGHAGTLDPLATGVLPIALGEATKTAAYVTDARKIYAFTVRWGEARDTDDAEGRVVAESAVRPSAEAVRVALAKFLGRIEQVPPAFAAIKVAGERAYARARRDENVELAPRVVEIARLELLDCPDADHARFRVQCGKGTYVRALARDLAVHLGTVGHIQALRREAVGRFGLESAISLAQLEVLGHSAAHNPHLIPLETALDDIPALALNADEANRLRRGQSVQVRDARASALLDPSRDDALFWAHEGGRAVAIVNVEGDIVRPARVFHL